MISYNNNKNTKKVLECIKKNKYGSTISDISKNTKLSKVTVTKILVELNATNVIIVKQSGRNKMHYVK